jgi:hypothetical protein
MSQKYARPVQICPEATINAAPKGGVEGAPGKEPKKDPEVMMKN